uniref:Uncharacterized protein n=1 Tax=Anopheles merus TaxID=30066 RepID=A0A182V1T6_ANOME
MATKPPDSQRASKRHCIRTCVLSELDVLKPLPHTPHTCGFSPVCVRIWRFSRLGRSNALPHTSHGSMARSDRAEGRALGEALDPGPLEMAASSRSSAPSQRSPPPVLAPDEIEIDESSPDTDLCSSSAPEDGEIGSITRDRSDVERSSDHVHLRPVRFRHSQEPDPVAVAYRSSINAGDFVVQSKPVSNL